jgi:hypothetical protein
MANDEHVIALYVGPELSTAAARKWLQVISSEENKLILNILIALPPSTLNTVAVATAYTHEPEQTSDVWLPFELTCFMQVNGSFSHCLHKARSVSNRILIRRIHGQFCDFPSDTL